MVCHRSGYWWSFPKGHAEPGELPQMAAARELKEETGLTVTHFLDVPTQREAYRFRLHGELVDKQVTYFLAEVKGELTLQDEELVDAVWVPLTQIQHKATYPEGKAMCFHIIETLTTGGGHL